MGAWSFYIGSYTEPIRFGTGELLDAKGEGIGFAALDVCTGKLQISEVFGGIRNPSYLALTRNNVYAVNEMKGQDEKFGGMISAFRRDTDGWLTFLCGVQGSGAINEPCHSC